ncbi:hypothetical protein ABH922_005359 [Rhodococcus sp. 27YEA15]
MSRSTAHTCEPSKGRSHRPVTGRSSPYRQQAPCDRRPARHSLGGVVDRRKQSRCHPADASGRGDSTYSWLPWSAAESAPKVVRRPWIRPRQVSELAPRQGDHTDDRPPRCRTRFRTRQGSLGGRTDLRLAPPIQTPTNTFRDARGPSPRTTRTRMQHHLLEATTEIILKRSVTPGIRNTAVQDRNTLQEHRIETIRPLQQPHPRAGRTRRSSGRER